MKATFFVVLGLVFTISVHADEMNQPMDGGSSNSKPVKHKADRPDDNNEKPPGGKTVPNGDTRPPDDTKLGIRPAPDLQVRGGYAGYGDNRGWNHGAGVGVTVFLNGPLTGLLIDVESAGGQGSPFAYVEGDLRFRYRKPIDTRHIIWGGLGLDINGRIGPNSDQTHVESYFTGQLPTAFIGTMFNVGDGACVIHILGKASFGIYDSQTQADDRSALNRWARPAAGAEVLANCGTLRVIGDYQHVFSFADESANTDKARLQFSKVWSFRDNLKLGGFGKAEYTREDALTGLPADDVRGQTRHAGKVLFGLEFRWR